MQGRICHAIATSPNKRAEGVGEPTVANGLRVAGARVSAELVGSSASMRDLRAAIARLAPTDATVLIQGPSGSGKENAARAIHARSGRASGCFEAVNCGAIPAELAEAELFGVESGAFTGATRSRPGRLEAAHGGTLFLDEIGDLPPALQVKLLRVLETRQVERLGGGRPLPVDFRLVAATNVDLESAVAAGRFRADLYWRLAVVWLDIPPLRERTADIPGLIAHFAALHRQTLSLSDDGVARLAAHDWPGNLRELRNLVDRALAWGERHLDVAVIERLLGRRRRPVDDWLQSSGIADQHYLTHHQAHQQSHQQSQPALNAEPMEPVALKALLQEAEMAFIQQALAVSGGAVAPSARLLGLKRTTLIEKMRRMGLRPPANEAA